MHRYLPWLLGGVAVAVAAIVLAPLFGGGSFTTGPQGLAGQAAAVFSLQDDRGAGVSLAQYRNRIVVMNLWASWCPPCREELPDLQRLANRYSHGNIVVVGVNEGESPQRARSFAASLRIRFPIWVDSSERYGRIYAALGLPTTIVLNRRGVIVRGYDGALTFDQMQSAVDAALRNS
ncbi:MAG: TlpA family protein disulfide reductase [Candidatus Eremiobacteraeota bacterium]|nr:TlpA family protein disulfide reductase [Candidatus Eremiobacteraeota bacterium]